MGTLALKLGASKGCTAFHIGSVMTRQLKGKSPIEKLHARAVDLALSEDAAKGKLSPTTAIVPRPYRRAMSAMAVETVSDEKYFLHLEAALNEYFDDVLGL